MENTLNIIFINYGELYWILPHLLWEKRQSLLEADLQYESFYKPSLGQHSLELVSNHFSRLADAELSPDKRAESKKLLAGYRQKLEKDASAPNLVWVFLRMPGTAMEALNRWLQESAILNRYAVRPLLAIQRQDMAFGDTCRLLWKRKTFFELESQYLKPHSFCHYTETYEQLSACFGAENCRVLPFEPLRPLRDFQASLAEELGIAHDIFAGARPAPFPRSYAGLDMLHACQDFFIEKYGRQECSREAFHEMLTAVEKEQDFRLFPRVPLPGSRRIKDALAGDNARLGERIGRQLFIPDTIGAEVVPEPLPVITAKECQPFVEAMSADLRHALMRYLRQKAGLLPEQENLAQALENFRLAKEPKSGFCWPRKKPVLSVLTMTRNHKSYIMDCMRSVSSQRTDFAIEHVIVDDASDDGTQDIVDNYASAHAHVRPIYLSNRSVGGANVRTLFEACKSPFAALCDGDDYFTDNQKLKRQMEYLKKNSDCAVCFHPVLTLFENIEREPFVFPSPNVLPPSKNNKFYLASLVRGNFIQTNSVVYRWRFGDGLPDWFRSDICPADWYWHVLHAEKGKIGFLPHVMSVYRRHENAHYNNAFIDSTSHRRQHGMQELETYKVINEHFNNRYFLALSSLANGVLLEYVNIYNQEDNSSLLDEACEKYPDFTRQFLHDLKVVHKLHPAKNPSVYDLAVEPAQGTEGGKTVQTSTPS